jgi:hypothetical protein
MRFRGLLAQLLPLFLVTGLTVAAPAYAWTWNNWTWNNYGSDGVGGGVPPAIPEPASWLVLGAGLLVVVPYVRNAVHRRDR